MKEVGTNFLRERLPQAEIKFFLIFLISRTGFHVPPFNSLEHLHMHIISGEYKNFFQQIAFSSFPWFRTTEKALSIIQKKYLKL